MSLAANSGLVFVASFHMNYSIHFEKILEFLCSRENQSSFTSQEVADSLGIEHSTVLKVFQTFLDDDIVIDVNSGSTPRGQLEVMRKRETDIALDTGMYSNTASENSEFTASEIALMDRIFEFHFKNPSLSIGGDGIRDAFGIEPELYQYLINGICHKLDSRILSFTEFPSGDCFISQINKIPAQKFINSGGFANYFSNTQIVTAPLVHKIEAQNVHIGDNYGKYKQKSTKTSEAKSDNDGLWGWLKKAAGVLGSFFNG